MSPRPLFDFSSAGDDDPAAWRSIDDPVMGGISESDFRSTEPGAAFTGTVSLEHGGGFASVRAPDASYDLSDARGLALRVRGDGKRYWCTFYTADGGPVSYRVPMEPPTEWTTVTVTFDDLIPYRRGTTHPDAPRFNPGRVTSLGFLIADEQEGPFRLEISWIRSLRDNTDG